MRVREKTKSSMTPRFWVCTLGGDLMSLTQEETLGGRDQFWSPINPNMTATHPRQYVKIANESMSGGREDRLEIVINI